MNYKIFIAAAGFFVLFFTSQKAQSQPNKLGSWSVANAEFYLNSKWNLWSEAQLRSQKVYDEFYYHELKGGINYRPNKSVGILLGTGQYATYSNGGNFKSPVLNHEFRIWEQFTIVNNINRFKIEHRYRIEQRWRTDGYRNRFRYRLNAVIPLNKSRVDKGTLYASVFDEIFLTNRRPYFERNRLFGGFGYQFSNTFTLQTGLIRQFDYNGSTNSGSKKDFLQTTLFFRIRQRKSVHETHPSSID